MGEGDGYWDYYYEEEERDWNDYQHEKFIEMRNDLHEAELSELETEGEEDEPGNSNLSEF
jgi:hypothetical protein